MSFVRRGWRMQEKRKSDGKSYGIILKGISEVILASVRIQEEKRDKAERGKKENYSKEGKVPEGFGGFAQPMRGIIHVLINGIVYIKKMK